MTNTHALFFLSAAKLAIRESTGGAAPTECWGYATERDHQFAQCPQKNDPATFARAMDKIADFRTRYFICNTLSTSYN